MSKNVNENSVMHVLGQEWQYASLVASHVPPRQVVVRRRGGAAAQKEAVQTVCSGWRVGVQCQTNTAVGRSQARNGRSASRVRWSAPRNGAKSQQRYTCVHCIVMQSAPENAAAERNGRRKVAWGRWRGW